MHDKVVSASVDDEDVAPEQYSDRTTRAQIVRLLSLSIFVLFQHLA